MRGRFVTHSLSHSLTMLLVRFTQIWGKTPYMDTKYKCVRHQNINASVVHTTRTIPPCVCEAVNTLNTEEVLYVFSLRYRILSLKIDSLPSYLHTKRIHSDGKSVCCKTDRLIEGPFRDTLPSCKELTIVREKFLYDCITYIYSQHCKLETTIEVEGGL